MRPVLAGLLAAAASASAALAPAAAHADGAFTATDFAWTAGGGGTTVTIAPGERVSFGYPSGMSLHNAQFAALQPAACTPSLPADPAEPGWSSLCTFSAGDYTFACSLHPTMAGRVVAAGAGGTPPPPPPPPPTAEPNPPPPLPATATGPAASSLKLARAQRGTTVRGSLVVSRSGSRLDVRARRNGLRVGRALRRAVGPGRVRFAVALDRAARRALARSGRLRLSVRIVVTPATGARYVATRAVTIRRRPA